MDYEQLILGIVESKTLWNDLSISDNKLRYIKDKIGVITKEQKQILINTIEILLKDYIPDKDYKNKAMIKAAQITTTMLALLTLAETNQSDFDIIANVTHYGLIVAMLYFLFRIDGDTGDSEKLNKKNKEVTKKLKIIRLALITESD